MSSFDPAKAFQREFDEIRKVARTGSAAAKAPLKQRLLALLDLYRLKLPANMHQTRTAEAGSLLHGLGEQEAALAHCFAPILRTAADDKLADSGTAAVQLATLAEYGSIEASWALLLRRDAWLLHGDSQETTRQLLARLTGAMRKCLPHEPLYWLVFNGTLQAYRMCTALMRPERAAVAIEPLAWCVLCMEGMVPLLQPRFLRWRTTMYVALCHCYEAIGQLDGAAQAAAHALEHLATQRKLDRHDPVGPSAKMLRRYRHAETALGALSFKYKALKAGGGAEAGGAAAAPPAGKGKPPAKGAPAAAPAEEAPPSLVVRGTPVAELGEDGAAQVRVRVRVRVTVRVRVSFRARARVSVNPNPNPNSLTRTTCAG